MTFGTLCTGFGGIDLGLRNAGLSCRFQCEINTYDRALLEQNFPECGTRLPDVRDAGKHNLPAVDLVAFGFMCTDIANVNRNSQRIEAETRSGITWRESIRVVSELLPRFVLIENVAALVHKGLDTVLRSLATLGYDAEWHCIPASFVGAPHERDRVFIMAWRNIPDANDKPGLQTAAPSCSFGDWWNSREDARGGYWRMSPAPDWSLPEAVSVRMADGLPNRLERVKGLGNSVVPAIPEMIGLWFLETFRMDSL